MLQRVSRREADDYGQGFVKEVNVRDLPVRNRRMERLLGIFWVVIIVKCVFIWWVIRHFRIPFHPLWVVGPTLIFAVVCTAVYHWRD
ncbi:MAG: hypothetical protein ACREFX_03000 [Opitutaceae bacterium]